MHHKEIKRASAYLYVARIVTPYFLLNFGLLSALSLKLDNYPAVMSRIMSSIEKTDNLEVNCVLAQWCK